MSILITGGAGFIGSHLTETLLKEGKKVAILDNFSDNYPPEIKRNNLANCKNQIQIFEGDILDTAFLSEIFSQHSFETIVHLAARPGVLPSIKNPDLYCATNIVGTLNLLENARKYKIPKLIFGSSSSVYGINSLPFKESDTLQGSISPYAMSKISGEQLCFNYSYLYGINTVCLRFFTVYGPRQRPDLAIAKFTQKIFNEEPIDQYGDGKSSRDYTYVLDIVSGILSAIQYKEKPFDIFNLGRSDIVDLKSLIQSLEKTIGKKAIINQISDQAGDISKTFADISKSQKLLGYQPQTSLEQGLKNYFEWFKTKNPS